MQYSKKQQQGTPIDLFVIENLINRLVRSNVRMIQNNVKQEILKHQGMRPSRRRLTPKKEEEIQPQKQRTFHQIQHISRPKSESVSKKFSTININEQNQIPAQTLLLRQIREHMHMTKSQLSLKQEIQRIRDIPNPAPLIIKNINQPIRIKPIRPSMKTLPSNYHCNKQITNTIPQQIGQRLNTDLSGWHTHDEAEWD